jgi:hypothetical protein
MIDTDNYFGGGVMNFVMPDRDNIVSDYEIQTTENEFNENNDVNK